MQPNFEITSPTYVDSQPLSLAAMSKRSFETLNSVQSLPLEPELFIAKESIHDKAGVLPAEIQSLDERDKDQKIEFNQLLIDELEALEALEEDSIPTSENSELVITSPLIELEPAKKLDAKETLPTRTATARTATARTATAQTATTQIAEEESPNPPINQSEGPLSLGPLTNPISGKTKSFEMPPPGPDEFDFFSVNHSKTLPDAETPNQIVPNLPSALEPTGAVPTQDNSSAVSPGEVTQTVVDNLVQEVQLTENGESKRLTLQLHPAELGQVSLQIDWEHESLKLKIISNEMVTSEILNQNKPELVAMLAEQGIDFDSLDMSYESPTSEGERQSEDSSSRPLDPAMFATDLEAEVEEPITSNVSLTLDITA